MTGGIWIAFGSELSLDASVGPFEVCLLESPANIRLHSPGGRVALLGSSASSR